MEHDEEIEELLNELLEGKTHSKSKKPYKQKKIENKIKADIKETIPSITTITCNKAECEVDQVMSDGRSLCEKYEMLENFLKENNFKIIEKIDIYGNDFEVPFYNTVLENKKKDERFKNVIEVIRFFNKNGFSVFACGYRKKQKSNFMKRSRIESWIGCDYYWVKIDSFSDYFKKYKDNESKNMEIII